MILRILEISAHAIFILVIIFLIYQLILWMINLPVRRLEAKVLEKMISEKAVVVKDLITEETIKNRTHQTVKRDRELIATYYITFELSNEKEKVFEVTEGVFNQIHKDERGYLYIQDSKFKGWST